MVIFRHRQNWLLLFVTMLIASGCDRREARTIRDVPDRLAILEHKSLQGIEASYRTVLAQLYPKSQAYDYSQAEMAFADCMAADKILLIPTASTFPINAIEGLERFVAQGGQLILMGTDPFGRRNILRDGVLVSEAAVHQAIANDAKHVDGFSTIQSWQHRSQDGRAEGFVRVLDDRGVNWPGASIAITGYTRIDRMTVSVPDSGIPDSLNSMVFYARSGEGMDQAVLQCLDNRGRTWISPIHLSRKWQRYVVHEVEFHPVGGTEERAGPLSFRDVVEVSIGLDRRYTPVSPGDYVLDLTDIRLGRDDREVRMVTARVRDTAFAPLAEAFPLKADQVQSLESGRVEPTVDTALESPVPGFKGWGGEKASPRRWIPLCEAVTRASGVKGWPASINLDVSNGEQQWAWIAANVNERNHALIRLMLTETVRKLQTGRFLHHAGSDRFAFQQGHTMLAHASWTRGAASSPVRVVAELLHETGGLVRRVVTTVTPTADDAERVAVLNLGKVPVVKYEPEDYAVRVLLEDAHRQGVKYDEITQQIKIFPDELDLRAVEKLSIEGSRFKRHKRSFFIMGAHFIPYPFGMRMMTESTSWMHPTAFSPDEISRELTELGKAGINVIAVTYTSLVEAPQLAYVADEAVKRGFKWLVVVPRIEADEASVHHLHQLLSAFDLGKHPALLGVVLAMERLPEERAAPWIGYLVSSLRHEGFGARVSLFVPETPLHRYAGVAAQLDFLVLSVDQQLGLEGEFIDLGFSAALARGLTGGKPVLWADFGAPTDASPTMSEVVNQQSVYAGVLDTAIRSRSAGAVSGRFLSRERGYGMRADGTMLSSLDAFREVAARLRKERYIPQPWQDRYVDVPDTEEGWQELYEQWREVYREEVAQHTLQEVRPAGFGMSTELLLTDMGQEVLMSSTHAAWVQAIIGGESLSIMPGQALEARVGAKCEFELMNVGWSTWSFAGGTGGVGLRIEADGVEIDTLPLREVSSGKKKLITWTPEEAKVYLFQPYLEDVGNFGDPLVLRVSEATETTP